MSERHPEGQVVVEQRGPVLMMGVDKLAQFASVLVRDGRVFIGPSSGSFVVSDSSFAIRYPARTTCVVQALPDPKMLIEIECVASLAKA